MARRKKEPKSVHREKIASAASVLFMERGIAATSMDDIAIFSLNNCQRRDYTTCKLTCASTLLMFIKFPGGYTKIFLKPLHIMPKTF